MAPKVRGRQGTSPSGAVPKEELVLSIGSEDGGDGVASSSATAAAAAVKPRTRGSSEVCTTTTTVHTSY